MTDEQLFQTARLINSAVQAKIHTVEWTPAILSNLAMYRAMNGNWYGFASDSGHPINWKEKFLALLFDPTGKRGVRGAVGEREKFWGVPFSHTEEFVSIYRLHALMPNELSLYNFKKGVVDKTYPLVDLRDQKSHHVTDHYSLTDLFYSIGREHPGQLALHNYPAFMTDMAITEPNGHSYMSDLAMIDILRDRERGVLRYNALRKQLHLREIPSFDYLTPDQPTVELLKKIYNNDVNQLDVLVGTLAESYRPEGFGFAETLFQVFLLTATRRLETDRFLTSDFTPEIYTKKGMEWVELRRMKDILMDHMPALTNILGPIKNPFRPWPAVSRDVASEKGENLSNLENENTPLKKSKLPWNRKPNSEALSCKTAQLNQEYGTRADDPSRYQRLASRMSKVMFQYAAKDVDRSFEELTMTEGKGGDTMVYGARRPFHAKAHGCLYATFNVLEDLNSGVFKSTNGHLNEYKAWVRFSNASGEMSPDGKDDLRGVAIKLLGVEGDFLDEYPRDESNTQDFLMTNAPSHFARDTEAMVKFAEALPDKPENNIGALFHMMKKGQLKTSLKARKQTLPPEESMTEIKYYSRVPFLVGGRAAKFSLTPCIEAGHEPQSTKNRSQHFLRADLIEKAEKGFCFNFNVQYQENTCSEDIEDARKEWKTPFHTVAQLIFKPGQKFTGTKEDPMEANEQDVKCEETRFNPWHGLKDHRPLGDMNRARLSVYYMIQGARKAPYSNPKKYE
jgi:hypothetical protein